MAHCEQLTHPHIYGPHLNDISLAGCARLTDASVEESCSASPSLLRLNICGCVGLRRPQIASSSLEVLNFGKYSDDNDNNFTGGIPAEWGALTNLKKLSMMNCGLDGGCF